MSTLHSERKEQVLATVYNNRRTDIQSQFRYKLKHIISDFISECHKAKDACRVNISSHAFYEDIYHDILDLSVLEARKYFGKGIGAR